VARVLVIEDNAVNLELMRYLLRAFGHTVLEATDGQKGFDALRRELPDLVVCDIQLPGIDGYEVARRAKSDRALKRIPLIAVTALAMVGDREKILAAGFDGYISKPIAPETFANEIGAVLGLQPGTPTARPDSLSRPGASGHAGPSLGTIVVVDDSPINRDLIRNTLEPSGYQVRLAESVAEARELLRKEAPPDLILSDLHMPDHDGFDFLRGVKADPVLAELPFVFISSSLWGEGERQKALKLGATRFILRPIEPQALLAEIGACMAGKAKE
jgi:two-component system cell cycle response regulator